MVVLFLPVEYFFSSFCYSSLFSNPVVQNGGKIGSRKGVNLPGKKVDLPVLNRQDEHYLRLGVEQGVDMVFASFIQDEEDVKAVREAMGEKGRHILVISKVYMPSNTACRNVPIVYLYNHMVLFLCDLVMSVD